MISKVMFLIFSLQILPKYSANKTLNIFLRLHENISNLISGGKFYLKGGKIFQERNKVFATNSNFLIFETWWCKPYFSSAFHGSYEFIGWNIKDPPQIFNFFLIIFAGAGFSNIPGKYENVVFIIKNPRNRNKCFQK